MIGNINKIFKFKNSFIKEFKSIPYTPDILSDIVHRVQYATYPGESRHDLCVRVIEGFYDIILNYTKIHDINFSISESYLEDMLITFFYGMWSPGGRVLRNLGTEKINKHGLPRLFNCGAISPDNQNIEDFGLDLYMYHKNQIGIGINVSNWDGDIKSPIMSTIIPHIKYTKKAEDIIYDILQAYSYGTELPLYINLTANSKLMTLHDNLIFACNNYLYKNKNKTRLIADISNIIAYYFSGNNNGRGAQILLGKVNDKEFKNLKNMDLNPERIPYGYMSNNSVFLEKTEDFLSLENLAESILTTGEPGIVNGLNLRNYGRLGEKIYNGHILSEPELKMVNPCGEIGLENYELCNLNTIIPTNIPELHKNWCKILEYATIFSSTLNLIDTNFEKTNKIMQKNRKIGISISGLAEMFETYPISTIINYLNIGYDQIRNINHRFAEKFMIPISKKVTTIKPDGNTSALYNVSPGIHNPVFDTFCIRRVVLDKKLSIVNELKTFLPYKDATINPKKLIVFEIPYMSKSKTVFDMSVWEQSKRVEILQKFWADNSISCTIYYDPAVNDLGNILPMTEPFKKTSSYMTKMPENYTEYKDLPYETISEKEYLYRIKNITKSRQ